MSGYVYILGACYVCGLRFGFNPHRVPSVTDPTSGEREPICRHCIIWVNEERAARGLDTWPVYEDAYEAIPAEQF